jgi:hypothetical protein
MNTTTEDASDGLRVTSSGCPVPEFALLRTEDNELAVRVPKKLDDRARTSFTS